MTLNLSNPAGSQSSQSDQSVDINLTDDDVFQRALKATNLGVIILGLNGEFKWVNDSFCRMIGYSEDEIRNATLFDLTHPEDARIGREKLRDLVDGKIHDFHLEKRFIHKNGLAIWCAYNVSLIRDDEGNPRHAIGHVMDVSQRKSEERSSQEYVERFKDFTHAINEQFWETDENFRFTYMSKSSEGSNFRSTELMIGKTREELTKFAGTPEGLKIHLAKLTAHMPFENHHVIAPGTNGVPLHLRVTGVPIFGEGNVFKGYRGASKDISGEIRAIDKANKTQKRFMDAMESLSVGFAWWGPDNRLIDFNAIYLDILGPDVTHVKIGIDYEEHMVKLSKSPRIRDSNADPKVWIESRMQELRQDFTDHETSVAEGRVYLVLKKRLDDDSIIAFYIDVTEGKKI